MANKSLLGKLVDVIDEHRAANPISHSTAENSRRWITLFPTLGNVLFTVLLVGGLLWGQNIGAFTLLAAPNAVSASTNTIAYQGRLADSAGAPLTQTVNMSFRLYSAASGGAPLWEEQWTGGNSVRVSDGLFNVMLGSVNPISQAVITGNSNLFLGITVGTDGEMTPRVQLGSVPFATQALTVPDGAITASKLAANAILTSVRNHGNNRSEYSDAAVTVNDTNWVVYPGTETTIQVSGPSRILVNASAGLKVLRGSGFFYAGICRNGSETKALNYLPSVSLVRQYEVWSWTYLDTVAAGSYSYSLCGKGSAGIEAQWYHPSIALVALPGQ